MKSGTSLLLPAIAAASLILAPAFAQADTFPVSMGLNAANTNVTIKLVLNGTTDLLNPAVQSLPIIAAGSNLNVDVEQTGTTPPALSISNPSGELTIQSPWNIITLLGALSITGGHITIGDGTGSFATDGSNPGTVDLGGLAIVLDGGAGSLLGQSFNFNTDPVTFNLPAMSNATITETGGPASYMVDLIVPVNASGDTELSGLGTLSYIIAGQIAFSGTKTVPEPGTLTLAAIGLAASCWFGARRRRQV